MISVQVSFPAVRLPSSGSVADPEKLIVSPAFQVVSEVGVEIVGMGGSLSDVPALVLTLSNVEVFRLALWLVKASPIYAAAGREMDTVPAWVQLVPLSE